MLEVSDLNIKYGHVHAVKEISFSLNKGEILSVLGANGAGKSSTLFGITGIVKSTGKVVFKGKELSRKNTVEGTRMGLVLCPENRRIFSGLMVEENLKLGAYARGSFKRNADMVYGLFPILKERSRQIAGSLSGGEQQMLAVGRALMAEPELLLLDEPSLGLAPVVVDEIFSVFRSLKERMSILLVEQNAHKALAISDRAYILQNGRIVHTGEAKLLLQDEALKKAYLGM